MISGVPSNVVAVADLALAALALARQTLTDPVRRERYDIQIGIRKPGSGLARPVSPPSEGLWDGIQAGMAWVAERTQRLPRPKLSARSPTG